METFHKKNIIHKVDKTVKEIVSCNLPVSDDGDLCNQRYLHTGPTTNMKNHLIHKHNIFKPAMINNNNLNPEDDINFVLLMFIITAALPFCCVENSFSRNFALC